MMSGVNCSSLGAASACGLLSRPSSSPSLVSLRGQEGSQASWWLRTQILTPPELPKPHGLLAGVHPGPKQQQVGGPEIRRSVAQEQQPGWVGSGNLRHQKARRGGRA